MLFGNDIYHVYRPTGIFPQLISQHSHNHPKMLPRFPGIRMIILSLLTQHLFNISTHSLGQYLTKNVPKQIVYIAASISRVHTFILLHYAQKILPQHYLTLIM